MSPPGVDRWVLIAGFAGGHPDLSGRAVSHAPDCRYAAANTRSLYVPIRASAVPARVPRCQRCGGGR